MAVADSFSNAYNVFTLIWQSVCNHTHLVAAKTTTTAH